MAGFAFDFEALRAQRRIWAGMETTGERFTIPRGGLPRVQTIVYRPENIAGKLPVLFNMHGGAWIGGDAVLMESFCKLLADSIPAVVVNVNYTKVDEQPFPFAQEEVCDAVKYFSAHAEEMGIDPERMAVGGHSAGAHIAAGSAMMLKERGIKLACQLLVYPCVDIREYAERYGKMMFPEENPLHRWASPLFAEDADLSGLAPAIFIECGIDDLKPQGIAYAKRLMDAAVPVKVKEYPGALHGFLEVNRPDYPADDRQTPEQAEYARDCENYLINELRACFAEG